MENGNTRGITANDLEQLLGMEVSKFQTRSLTSPGDNYGSIMLAVEATLKSGKSLSLVAKLFPVNEFALKLFQNPLSMKKEIGMYRIISPEYDRIQEEQSVPPAQRLNVFCSCPGARLTLNDSDEDDQLADENSVLLLENLKVQGYRTGDRVTGMDLKHTEFVLKHLARFHATAVAIKLKKPLVFRNKIRKVLTPLKMAPIMEEEELKRKEIMLESLQTIPACNRNIEVLKQIFKQDMENAYSDQFLPVREPFATIKHYDFWTNNMMFKYKSETDEDPIEFKIVDFQVSEYGSPVPDILLFLFTSTQIGIVSVNIERLLELYHQAFVSWLNILDCEISKFSYESFLNEVKIEARLVIVQIINMLIPITFNKEQIEMFKDNEFNEDQPPDFNDIYILKVSEAVDTFAAKGWL